MCYNISLLNLSFVFTTSCLSLLSVHKLSWMLIQLRLSWQNTRSTTQTSLCAVTPQLMTSLMWSREIGKLKCQNGRSIVIPSRCGLLQSGIPIPSTPMQMIFKMLFMSDKIPTIQFSDHVPLSHAGVMQTQSLLGLLGK